MEKKHHIGYDILTVIACLMVVFFHMNGIVYEYSDTISWKISVAVRCIVYGAIPIFFMLTGAKLMQYRQRYSTKEYIKKRLLRIGIPFLFWNLFYICYQLIRAPKIPFDSISDFISMFLNSEFQNRYWFFYPLFAVYAAIPVLSLLLQVKNHRKYLWYTVGAAFLLNWVLQPVCHLLGVQYNSHLLMPVCGGYLMYALFGYLVSTETWNQIKRIVLYAFALGSWVFAICYTVTASAATGGTAQYLFSYDCFPSALTGAAIFVFVKHLFDQPGLSLSADGKLAKFIRTLSECCMGVWLTHPLVIQILGLLTDFTQASYIWRFLFPPIVFTVCAFGTWIAKKIPILKYTV